MIVVLALLVYNIVYRERTMTLPDERYRAVLAAEQLLRDLCDPKKTPRVPAVIRGRARSALRHYPSKYDMYCAAAAAPGIFREEMEDLERFVASGLFDKGA
jgi:hypothetical protein